MMWIYALVAGVIGLYVFDATGLALAVIVILAALSYIADSAKNRHKELIAAMRVHSCSNRDGGQ